MFVQKAAGANFRNLEPFSIEFSKPLTIFTGDNGQGKSSLIEALYCALRGKSFQTLAQTRFISYRQNQSKISLKLKEEEGRALIDATFKICPQSGQFKRELFYCGKKVPLAFLSQKFPCFVFTEESVKCIRLGPDQRRAFVDGLLSQKDQKSLLEPLHRLLRGKARLLKDMGSSSPVAPTPSPVSSPVSPLVSSPVSSFALRAEESSKTLSVLNSQIFQKSLLLARARLKTLNSLFSSLQSSMEESFFSKPFPELAYGYYISGKEIRGDGSNLQPLLEEDFEKKKDLELRALQPLFGAQKHEIRFLFNGKDSRFFCSKGEQRLFTLSLLLAGIKNRPAFLFLDDVLMELDERHQNKFLLTLTKNPCQSFLTNCNLMSFRADNCSYFLVQKGKLTEHA